MSNIVIKLPDDYMKYIDIYEKGSLFDIALTNAVKNGINIDKTPENIKNIFNDAILASFKSQNIDNKFRYECTKCKCHYVNMQDSCPECQSDKIIDTWAYRWNIINDE